MSRSREFLDALEKARSHLEEHLARHETEVRPERFEAMVQRHAEQIHQTHALKRMKQERGMAVT